MKLSKAIELSLDCEQSLRQSKIIDHADAIKLGLEALKAIRDIRQKHPTHTIAPLPGEDPEPPTRRSLHHIKEVLESPLGKEPKDQPSFQKINYE